MKWIKVVDRLPNKGDLYFVKVKEINQDDSDWFPDTCNFYDEWQMSGKEYIVIEWLDEDENEATCYHCGDVIEHPLCRSCDVALTLPTEEY